MKNHSAMVRLLEATGPHPDHAEELMLFGQFIGSWDLDMTSHLPDGTGRQFVGEWHFGWALQGRAVQDVLITRSSEGEPVGYGSTVRSFDPQRGLWWVVWQDPVAEEFSVLLAHADGDRIVLDGRWTIDDEAPRFRWIFSAITPASFHWEALVLEDDGDTWRVVEEFQARRRSD